MNGLHSYSPSLIEHFQFPPVRQRTWRQHINLYAKEFSQLCANRTNIEEGCFLRGVDKDAQITVISILPVENRTEDAWILGMMPFHDLPYSITVLLIGN